MNVMQGMHNLMKPIPSEIKKLYDALLVKRGVPLKDKNQTEQQQKQAFHAVSIFYGIKNTDQDEIGALKNKKENISTKNTGLKSNSFDWRPVYKKLDSEIKLRHYSPKTLEAYRGWVRQLQGFTRSKDPQLLSSTDVKDLFFL